MALTPIFEFLMVFYVLFQLMSRGMGTIALLVLGALKEPIAKLTEERGDKRWSPRGRGAGGGRGGAAGLSSLGRVLLSPALLPRAPALAPGFS